MSNPVNTPIALGQKDAPGEPVDDNKPFRRLVGQLQYIATRTRPDISFTVNLLGRNVDHPTNIDECIAERCLVYLNSTKHLSIRFTKSAHSQPIFYTDADFAGDAKGYRSTNGCLALMAGGPIAWKSKLQHTVVTSTTEAEYLALSATTKLALFIKEFGGCLGLLTPAPAEIKCDNRSVVDLVTGQAITQRTRHMGAQLFFIRHQQQERNINVTHVPGTQQLADIMTKTLTTPKFTAAVSLLLFLISTSLAGAVMVARVKETLWLPTDIQVETGYRITDVRIPILSLCDNMAFDPKEVTNQRIQIIYQEALWACVDRANQLVEHKLRKINEITLPSKRLPRSIRPTKVKQSNRRRHPRSATQQMNLELTKSEDIGFSDGEFWSAGFLPFYSTSRNKYSDYGYEKNIIKHNKALEIMIPLVNKLANVTELQGTQNKIIDDQIRHITKILQDTTDVQASTAKFLPRLIGMIARSEEQITRYSISIDDLIKSAKLGYINKQTFRQLAGPDKRIQRDVIPEWHDDRARLVSISSEDNTIFMELATKTFSSDTLIYQAHQFKEWLTNNRYKTCTGHNYLLYNATANCTKVIGKPITQTVTQICNTLNKTDDSPHSCVEHTMKNNIDAVEPSIIKSDTDIYIQCFGNNITIGGETTECPKYPIAVPLNVSIEVGGHTHNFVHEAMYYQAEQANSTFNSSVTNPHQKSLINLKEWSDSFTKNNAEMNRTLAEVTPIHLQLNNMTIGDIFTLLLTWYGGLSSSALIITGIIIYLLLARRKGGLAKLVETSMLMNMTDRLSKSMPNLTRATSGSLTPFDHHIYPVLPTAPEFPRVHFHAGPTETRLATPYPSGDSFVDKDPLAMEALRRPPTPSRFPKFNFPSTLSLPYVAK